MAHTGPTQMNSGIHRVVGELAPHEDRAVLEKALCHGRTWVLQGAVQLLTHGKLRNDLPTAERERAQLIQKLKKQRLKRYVFFLETNSGPRIVKVAEPVGAGNHLAGYARDSGGRREHAYHRRAERAGIAASETRGFLELRRGLRLIRSLQVQTLVPKGLPLLEHHLDQERQRWGHEAEAGFGRALAETHRGNFFHADLKPFHAFVQTSVLPGETPERYRLLWIDLARVSFRLTPRRRIINLYQSLRFVIPRNASAQGAFMQAYCEACGWYPDRPDKALGRVRRFLNHKLKTHPNP